MSSDLTFITNEAGIQNPNPHVQLIVALDERGEILNLDTVTNIVPKDEKVSLKLLLAFLNSTLLSWYAYKFIYCSAIRTMHFDKYYVGKLIIPKENSSHEEAIVKLVDRILAAKQRDAEADTSALEREIDELVYALYGLTPEEKALVQAASVQTPARQVAAAK